MRGNENQQPANETIEQLAVVVIITQHIFLLSNMEMIEIYLIA